MENKKRKLESKNICRNCNKAGHVYSNCKEPVMSYGIVLFKSMINCSFLMYILLLDS